MVQEGHWWNKRDLLHIMDFLFFIFFFTVHIQKNLFVSFYWQ